jgi:hypothetical protein
LPAVIVGMLGHEARHLDRLRQQRPGTGAQHFGQWIGAKVPGWANRKTLVSVTAYHSFGGEVEARTPHDSPPYPFMPSPTFAHSSFNPRSVLCDLP